MIINFERMTQKCAHIWLDNLPLPCTSKSEVIWDQTTSNFLVYNLQLPHITSNFVKVATVMVVMVVMVDRTGRDWTGHLNLTFQVICDWQLLQFLRCLFMNWEPKETHDFSGQTGKWWHWHHYPYHKAKIRILPVQNDQNSEWDANDIVLRFWHFCFS